LSNKTFTPTDVGYFTLGVFSDGCAVLKRKKMESSPKKVLIIFISSSDSRTFVQGDPYCEARNQAKNIDVMVANVAEIPKENEFFGLDSPDYKPYICVGSTTAPDGFGAAVICQKRKS
jgi:hypothetical protein